MESLEVKPLSGNIANKLIIFLHGLGSDGQDLIGLTPYFAPSLQDAHFYSPNGIEKCDLSPFGYQWFSLKNRDPNIIAGEIERVSQSVLDLIEAKLNELKLTYEDLAIIGFSQGTMLGLYLCHAFELNIGAMVGFSGAFLPPSVIKNNKTPICLIHGTSDEVVSFASMTHAEERLKNIGVKIVETHSIQNIGHTIDLNGLKFATNFLLKYLK